MNENTIYPTYSSQHEWLEQATDRLPFTTHNELVWLKETLKNTLIFSKV